MTIIKMNSNNRSFLVLLLASWCLLLCISTCNDASEQINEESVILKGVLRKSIRNITEDESFIDSKFIYFDTAANFDYDLAKSRLEWFSENAVESSQKVMVRYLVKELNFKNPSYSSVLVSPMAEDFEIITEFDRMIELGESVVGFLRISNMVIQGDRACFYMAFYCGSNCLGSGNIVFLEKKEDWEIMRISPLWSSKPPKG